MSFLDKLFKRKKKTMFEVLFKDNILTEQKVLYHDEYLLGFCKDYKPEEILHDYPSICLNAALAAEDKLKDSDNALYDQAMQFKALDLKAKAQAACGRFWFIPTSANRLKALETTNEYYTLVVTALMQDSKV